MNGDAADLAADDLAFPVWMPALRFSPSPCDLAEDCVSGSHGLSGLIEPAQEAVAGTVHLAPAERAQLLANGGVVRCHEASATRVADSGSNLGRPYDVGEEDRRQESGRLASATDHGVSSTAISASDGITSEAS